MNAITVTASGFSLSGPLVAGEPGAVSVSGVELAENAALSLAMTARFPDALLASCDLAEDEETPGTWTGTLDTCTKQTAFYFQTARADEARPVALELIDTAHRESIARISAPIVNSALLPSPFGPGGKDASPVLIPVPGAKGDKGDKGDPGTGIASPDGTVIASIQDGTNSILLTHPYRVKFSSNSGATYDGTHFFVWEETDASTLDGWPTSGQLADSNAYLEYGKTVAEFNAGTALAVRMKDMTTAGGTAYIAVGVRNKSGDITSGNISAWTNGIWKNNGVYTNLLFFKEQIDSIVPVETR